ncbi:cation-translocating P-type ATPase [Haliangium sp.]|uniref:cation-translocating P-type ATPase n=1 Tax=Haliangium sp. TaxID=2663208 RepID=UPI003D12EEEC
MLAAHGLGPGPTPGLSRAEAARRLQRWGPNQLRAISPRSAWAILLAQFRNLLVALLAAAAALSLVFGQWVEGLAVVAVLVINAAIGFFTELSAVRSMDALRKLGGVRANVRRDGEVRGVAAQELVPGDVVVLEGGDAITADLRLIEASKLQANESTLTGESLPVNKRVAPLAPNTILAERANMLFKGTSLTRGAGEAVVVATGMNTELGHISRLVETAEEEVTPLEKRLERMGRALVWLTLIIAALVGAAGILGGRELLLVVQTAIALAVASVPEGLPIIATIALARGMHRMARRNALITRLSAVETLGATTVICCDKTGTLTENRMTVVALERPPGVEPAQAAEVGALCNNASLAGVGDPLEVALLVAAVDAGVSLEALDAAWPEHHEVAFDPELKMMATIHRDAGEGDDAATSYRVAVKGAPEPVLAACALPETEREAWLARNRDLAGRGLRVLALAEKRCASADDEVYTGLSLVGLVGLADPPRADAADAIAACREAGVRVVMITGDQPLTARSVARAVGILPDLATDADEGDEALAGQVVVGAEVLGHPDERERRRLLDAAVFARFSPEQKLALIALHQAGGEIVAMTGDGVNDAPALKKADIGVAMGKRGTEVARQAADMVLRDDAFSTIVVAIEQGRIIFENLRKFVVYLMSCNLSELLAVGLATAVGAPLPLLPLQILFLNMVTDVFPALALGVGEGDPTIMKAPPRDPAEAIVTTRHWRAIVLYGLAITAAVLAAFALALGPLGLAEAEAVTVSFTTLALAQLWHVFNLRAPAASPVNNAITRNRYVWGALAVCLVLLALALYLPPLAEVLGLRPPGATAWLLIAGASVAPTVLIQLGLSAVAARRRRIEPPGRGERSNRG